MQKKTMSINDLLIVIAISIALTLLETASQSLLTKFHLVNVSSKHYKLLYYPFISWLLI